MDIGTCRAVPRRCNHKIQTVENYGVNGLGPAQVNCSENKEIEGDPVDSVRLNRHNNNKRETRCRDEHLRDMSILKTHQNCES